MYLGEEGKTLWQYLKWPLFSAILLIVAVIFAYLAIERINEAQKKFDDCDKLGGHYAFDVRKCFDLQYVIPLDK